MATKLTLVVAGDIPGASAKVLVEESFDDVLDKAYPTMPAQTSIEERGRRVFNKSDGSGRVLIPSGNIAWVEENAEEES